MHNLTDRDTEQAIRDNAAYKVFCGFSTVDQIIPSELTKKQRIIFEDAKIIVPNF